MKTRLTIIAAALLIAGPLAAQDWRAIGRIELGAEGYCTGALIAPDTILTAAHCLYTEDGMLLSAAELQFQAGFSRGAAYAYRRIKSIVLHPDFIPDANLSGTALRAKHDVALLRLYQPFSTVTPFALTEKKTESVTLVSYGTGGSDVMAIEEGCGVLAEDSGVHLFGCRVDFGASGAPVLADEDGTLKVFSIISAKGEMQGYAVGIGPSLVQEMQNFTP